MKYIFSCLFIIFCTKGMSQCKTYMLTAKKDTLNCTDMQGMKQGKWVIRLETVRGEPGYEEEGIFEEGKKEGTWRRFNLMGDLIAIENYQWGNKNGRSQYFTMMGDLLREESWKAYNPDQKYDTIDVVDVFDPNKYIRKIIKTEGGSLKHGTWKYYEPTSGLLLKSERYLFGELSTEPDDQFVPQKSIPKADTEAIPGDKKPAPPKNLKSKSGG